MASLGMWCRSSEIFRSDLNQYAACKLLLFDSYMTIGIENMEKYCCKMREAETKELVYGAAATLLYLIAFAVQAGTTHTRYQNATSNWYNTYAAAAAFALFTTICYGVDAFLAFRNWQSGGTSTGGNTATA